MVAQELEQIPGKAVGARLCHGVDRPRRVHPVLGGQPAGGHLELLQRIGEGEREVRVVIRIVVHGPVEGVRHAGPQPAGDGDGHRLVAVPVATDLARVDGRSGEDDQVGHLAPLERELQNLRLAGHLADARALHVHQRRGRFHRDRFLERAEPERHIDDRRAADLQHEARPDVGLEPGQRYVQLVGPQGQVRHDVSAGPIGHHGARDPRVGLCCGDGDPWQHAATVIGHRAAELSRRLRPGDATG